MFQKKNPKMPKMGEFKFVAKRSTNDIENCQERDFVYEQHKLDGFFLKLNNQYKVKQ